MADLDLSQYTEESAAVFRTAFANAQAAMRDETLSEDEQKTVDDAVQALSYAKDQLQLKGGSDDDNSGYGDGNTGSGDNNNNSGSTGSGNANAKADAPKTGDAAMPFGMLALAAAAGAAAVVSFRKKQSR